MDRYWDREKIRNPTARDRIDLKWRELKREEKERGERKREEREREDLGLFGGTCTTVYGCVNFFGLLGFLRWNYGNGLWCEREIGVCVCVCCRLRVGVVVELWWSFFFFF